MTLDEARTVGNVVGWYARDGYSAAVLSDPGGYRVRVAPPSEPAYTTNPIATLTEAWLYLSESASTEGCGIFLGAPRP